MCVPESGIDSRITVGGKSLLSVKISTVAIHMLINSRKILNYRNELLQKLKHVLSDVLFSTIEFSRDVLAKSLTKYIKQQIGN